MKKTLLLLCAMFAMFACSKKCGTKFTRVHLESYITAYFTPTGLSLEQVENKDELVVINLSLNIPDSTWIVPEPDGFVSFLSEGEKHNEYISLSKKYKDTSYNSEYSVLEGDENRIGAYRKHWAVDYNPTEINVTSEDDFDENHKAGSSLNDLVSLNSSNLYEYIQNNYTTDGTSYVGGRTIPLNKIKPEDMILLFNYASALPPQLRVELTFNSSPTLSSSHTFYVTMISDDMREFSQSIKIDFK